MTEQLTARQAIDKVKEYIARYPQALVAYSGGVGSTVVSALACEVLGDNSRAMFAKSPMHPIGTSGYAGQYAQELKMSFGLFESPAPDDPEVMANKENRCALCSQHLLDFLNKRAEEIGCPVVLSGDYAGKSEGNRCNLQALGCPAPLAELGIDRDLAVEMAKELNLSVVSKPWEPCVATHVELGTTITPKMLQNLNLGMRWLQERLGEPNAYISAKDDKGIVNLPTGTFANITEDQRAFVTKRLTMMGFSSVEFAEIK